MLKLNKVIINNFWSYKKAEITFNNLEPVLVLGQNLQSSHSSSNGSGKSSLFYSILWGLFGKIGLTVPQDSVVNRQEGKDCLVEVQGLIDNKKFVIKRYRSHTEFKNELHFTLDDYDSRGKSNSETQAKIEASLKVDFNSFMQTSFFNPSISNLFCTLTDSSQKEIFHNILNFSMFDSAYKQVKEEISSVEDDMTKYSNYLEIFQSEKASFINSLHIFKADNNFMVVNKNYDSIIDRITNNILSNYQKIEDVHYDSTRHSEIYKQVTVLESESSRIDSIPDVCTVCKQVVDQEVIKKYGSNIQVNLDKLNVKLNDFILIKSKNEINKNLISSIQADIAKLEDTYEEQESEESKKSLYLSNLGTFKERINEYSLKINKYGTLLTKYTEKINLLRTVKTALSNVGIKTQIINTLIPILNIKINKYSQELIGPHVSITIKTTKETNTKTIQNKFFVDIKGYASYNSCSSGEKRKVDICVLLGFADMLTHINRQNNFIIFDELVDNLDNVGLERCSNLIKNLNYDNIFIVTHNEEMKNYFNNVLFIEKTPDGISRLRVQ